jgi:hypothetical protein
MDEKMKIKRVFILLMISIIISACNVVTIFSNNDLPLFELFTVSGTESMVHYSGLTPGVSTVEDVILAMDKTSLVKQDKKENPFIGHNGSGQIVYSYGLVPKAKHYVVFTFTSENILDEIDVVVRDTHVGEFIEVYGEPSNVLFFVSKRFNRESCGMIMFYDEYDFHVSLGIFNFRPGKCILSERETIGDIRIYSEQRYDNYKEGFLSQWEMEIPGVLDDYLSPWKGYGDMIELYPNYLIFEEY